MYSFSLPMKQRQKKRNLKLKPGDLVEKKGKRRQSLDRKAIMKEKYILNNRKVKSSKAKWWEAKGIKQRSLGCGGSCPSNAYARMRRRG